MRIGLRDIADKAGVSHSTVSRVLNRKPGTRVSEATRKRILKVAGELGYEPNRHARALRSGRSSLVSLGFWSVNAHVSALKAWRLHGVLDQLGREVIATDLGGSSDLEGCLRVISRYQPEVAVLLLGGPAAMDAVEDLCDALTDEGVHVLLVDCHWVVPESRPCDAITVDRAHGACMAVEHLIHNGHQNVGLLAGEASDRLPGCRAALRKHGLPDDHLSVVGPGSDVAEAGRVALHHLLDTVPETTGIFCHSDLVAIGALKGLEERGVKVPDEMAVVGFDNDPWTALLPVPLTTVAHPIDEMCRATVEMLRERLDNPDGPCQRVELQPRLVVRASSGPA